MTNRTPTDVINSVEQWASHIITQPNDPMRKDVAAVLATCRYHFAQTDPERLDTYAHMVTAFVAAGVGGGE